ncbi:MAG: hypothetical protein AB7G24_02975 [Novosphingobium sp.]
MQIIGCLIFGIFGIAQLVAAYNGVEYYWGFWASAIVIGLCFMFRFSLPITVFSFLGAMHVWGWPWYGALAFAAPGIVLIVPSILASVIDLMKGAASRKEM